MDQTSFAALQLRFWGVRGSTPTPIARNLRHGGNTPCLEIAGAADEVLIFDAGSGIHDLGMQIMGRTQPPSAIHIFFTHFHWDHVQGLPFFEPLYAKASHLVFHSVRPPEELRAILAAQMAAPYFPVSFNDLTSRMEFRQLVSSPEQIGDINVRHFPLHHPQGSVGFRIDGASGSIVYATDHEHGDATIDHGLREAAGKADLLVYDAQYTPEEYASRQGWGHSTWLEATHVAQDAGVKQLALFHHDPKRDDDSLDRIVEQAQRDFPQTFAASETV